MARRGLWSDHNPTPPWEFRHRARDGEPSSSRPMSETPRSLIGQPQSFTCSAKPLCKQMTPCGEAKFYLTQCGLSSLDGDGDGVPCEAVYRHREP